MLYSQLPRVVGYSINDTRKVRNVMNGYSRLKKAGILESSGRFLLMAKMLVMAVDYLIIPSLMESEALTEDHILTLKFLQFLLK